MPWIYPTAILAEFSERHPEAVVVTERIGGRLHESIPVAVSNDGGNNAGVQSSGLSSSYSNVSSNAVTPRSWSSNMLTAEGESKKDSARSAPNANSDPQLPQTPSEIPKDTRGEYPGVIDVNASITSSLQDVSIPIAPGEKTTNTGSVLNYGVDSFLVRGHTALSGMKHKKSDQVEKLLERLFVFERTIDVSSEVSKGGSKGGMDRYSTNSGFGAFDGPVRGSAVLAERFKLTAMGRGASRHLVLAVYHPSFEVCMHAMSTCQAYLATLRTMFVQKAASEYQRAHFQSGSKSLQELQQQGTTPLGQLLYGFDTPRTPQQAMTTDNAMGSGMKVSTTQIFTAENSNSSNALKADEEREISGGKVVEGTCTSTHLCNRGFEYYLHAYFEEMLEQCFGDGAGGLLLRELRGESSMGGPTPLHLLEQPSVTGSNSVYVVVDPSHAHVKAKQFAMTYLHLPLDRNLGTLWPFFRPSFSLMKVLVDTCWFKRTEFPLFSSALFNAVFQGNQIVIIATHPRLINTCSDVAIALGDLLPAGVPKIEVLSAEYVPPYAANILALGPKFYEKYSLQQYRRLDMFSSNSRGEFGTMEDLLAGGGNENRGSLGDRVSSQAMLLEGSSRRKEELVLGELNPEVVYVYLSERSYPTMMGSQSHDGLENSGASEVYSTPCCIFEKVGECGSLQKTSHSANTGGGVGDPYFGSPQGKMVLPNDLTKSVTQIITQYVGAINMESSESIRTTHGKQQHIPSAPLLVMFPDHQPLDLLQAQIQLIIYQYTLSSRLYVASLRSQVDARCERPIGLAAGCGQANTTASSSGQKDKSTSSSSFFGKMKVKFQNLVSNSSNPSHKDPNLDVNTTMASPQRSGHFEQQSRETERTAQRLSLNPACHEVFMYLGTINKGSR